MNSEAVVQIERAGFAVIPDILDEDEVCEISRQLEFVGTANAGTRHLLKEAWCRGLGQRLARDSRLSNLIPHGACAVQCTYFTKSSSHNWLVTLHQDLSIPVADRIENEHCSGWSLKEGGLFVQPPSSFLEDILAVRIHLDDTDDVYGPSKLPCGLRWPLSDGISDGTVSPA